MLGLVEGQHDDSGHKGVVGCRHFLARQHQTATYRRHGTLLLAVHAHFAAAAIVPDTLQKLDFFRVDVLLKLVDMHHGVRHLGDCLAQRCLRRIAEVDRLGVDLERGHDCAGHLGLAGGRRAEHIENWHVLDSAAHDVRE